MTENEVYQRVGTALIETFTEGFVLPAGESRVEAISRLSEVAEGHIPGVLRSMMGLSIRSDGEVVATTPQLKAIYAQLTMPITKSQQTTNSYAVTTHGNNNQLMVGDKFNGSQSMNNITVGQMLDALKAKVEAVDAPAEQKRSLLASINEISKHPIVVKLVESGIKLWDIFR